MITHHQSPLRPTALAGEVYELPRPRRYPLFWRVCLFLIGSFVGWSVIFGAACAYMRAVGR